MESTSVCLFLTFVLCAVSRTKGWKQNDGLPRLMDGLSSYASLVIVWLITEANRTKVRSRDRILSDLVPVDIDVDGVARSRPT